MILFKLYLFYYYNYSITNIHKILNYIYIYNSKINLYQYSILNLFDCKHCQFLKMLKLIYFTM